ncbi:MAG: nicotinate-nucleotide adenylyltransferase [Planctomycetota bacterium]
MKIVILGGTFDPIHNGHVALARAARRALRPDRLLLIPARVPPHKARPGIAPARDRLAMTKLAARGIPGAEASAMEISRGGVSYTVDTLRRLRRRYGAGAEIFFLIGADSLRDLAGWRRARDLCRQCVFAVAVRPGVPLRAPAALADVLRLVRVPMRPVDASSSEIRRRLVMGRPIRGLVPPGVGGYIRKKRLYINKSLGVGESASLRV